jgi:hypothetical protein
LTPGSDSYDPLGAEVVGVNEVSWLLEEQPDGVRFTTTDERAVFIEVTVPDDYAPEINALLDFATPIDRHIPLSPLYETRGIPADPATAARSGGAAPPG